MATGTSTTYRSGDKNDSQNHFRHDASSHYSAIAESIEKIIHRSENIEFKEECVRVLHIGSVTNRRQIRSNLIALVQENHLRKKN